MATLVLDALTRTIAGEEHLRGIDLRLDAGRFHVLLGPTRAGKTSLLRAIAGLDRPTAGAVRLEGDGDPGLRGNVAMVYQDFVNYPSLRVGENIAAPLRARRVARDEVARRVTVAATRVGLQELLDRRPDELSGGQQQRLAIARALVQEARVVLLDEPLANLDFKLRERLREDIRDLFEGSETIVIYATTDPAEAMGFGGHLIVLDEGRVLQHGDGRALYNAPRDDRVAQVLSDPPINLWDAERCGDSLHIGRSVSVKLPAHLAQLDAGPCRLGLRPHHLCTSPGDGLARVTVQVDLAEVNGSTTCLHARSDDLSLVAEESGVHTRRIGQEIDLFLDPVHLLAFHAGGRLVAAPE